MNKILKKLKRTGFFHIFGANVLNKVIAFSSTFILVRLLTKNEYGIFTYAFNIYTMIMLLRGLGLDSAILQLCCERYKDYDFQKNIIQFGIHIGSLFSLLLGLVFIFVALFAPLSFESARNLIMLMVLLPLFSFMLDVAMVVLRIRKDNVNFAKASLGNTMLTMLMSVAGAILFREKGLIFGQYIAVFATVLWTYGRIKIKFLSLDSGISTKDKKDLLSLGIVSMCNNGISQLLYIFDVFILGIIVSDETIIASYKVATLIPMGLNFIPSTLMVYVYPYFSEHINDGKWCMNNYKKLLAGVGSVNFGVVLLLILFSEHIISMAFGKQYLDIQNIFCLLCVNYFISGTFKAVSGNLLVTQRKVNVNFGIALVTGVVNIVADIYFISWWSIEGAAVANMLVVLLVSIFSTAYLINVFQSKIIR